jgi:quercetin dioxygenase-like cupin family protein
VSKPQKDEILDRLVFSDGLVETYARSERERSEPAGDHWTRPVLLERVAYLRKLAHFSDGSATDKIREFEGYSILLMVLVRSGDAVASDNHSHTFLVLDGRATLRTGGTLERLRTIAEGEAQGMGITQGTDRELQRGGLVHVAPGSPHQFLLSGDKSFSCMVIRVNQSTQLPASPNL